MDDIWCHLIHNDLYLPAADRAHLRLALPRLRRNITVGRTDRWEHTLNQEVPELKPKHARELAECLERTLTAATDTPAVDIKLTVTYGAAFFRDDNVWRIVSEGQLLNRVIHVMHATLHRECMALNLQYILTTQSACNHAQSIRIKTFTAASGDLLPVPRRDECVTLDSHECSLAGWFSPPTNKKKHRVSQL